MARQPKCENCGALLRLSADRTLLTCAYCENVIARAESGAAATRLSERKQPERKQPERKQPGRTFLPIVLVGVGVLGLGGYWVASDRTPRPRDRAVKGLEPQRPIRDAGPGPTRDLASRKTADLSSDVLRAAAKPFRPPSPRGPVLPVIGKQQAKRVLEPKLIACMKAHGVYQLLTRIGQGYGKWEGRLGPLKIVESSWVDYRPVPRLASLPLGACIGRAMSSVQSNTQRGNYIHFDLRNRGVKDPLKGAPQRLSRGDWRHLVIAVDDQARKCARKHSDNPRVGQQVSVHLTVRGVDGKVTRVSPSYINPRSRYGQCLVAVYKKVEFPKFRGLSQDVTYHLNP